MKTLIVVLSCIVCIPTNLVVALNRTQGIACDDNKWNLFKLEFGKRYENASENLQRFERFCKNLQKIIAHNEDSTATYQMGVNQFTDMSLAELESGSNRALGGGLLKRITNLTDIMNLTDDGDDLPDFVDWSQDLRRVSRVRNQRFCGSCWAFALVGLLEGQQKPSRYDKLIELSEQNLIDCNTLGYGCSGGLLHDTLLDIKKMGGLMSLADYPYVSGWHPRQRQACAKVHSKIVQSTRDIGEPIILPEGNENLLKKVVATYGPVAIGYHSTEKFHNYESGIYYEKECSKVGNHAMLIVGYGTDASGQDYWKVKNSWGDSSWNLFNKWGQRGYGFLARNRFNNCGIASHAVIVTKGVKSN